jgi:hypothetical protein
VGTRAGLDISPAGNRTPAVQPVARRQNSGTQTEEQGTKDSSVCFTARRSNIHSEVGAGRVIINVGKGRGEAEGN